MRLKKYLAVCCIMGGVLASCADDTCTDPVDTRLRVSITAPDPNLEQEDLNEQLVVTNENWIDSVQFATEHDEQIVSFALDPSKDSCSFVFFLKDVADEKDTLLLKYEREMVYVSEPCGFVQEYRNITGTYTRYSIDSVKLLKDEITTLDETPHLAIYY